MKKLILGSKSPRRRELLAGLDIPFSAVSIDADESYPKQTQAGDIPLYISREKARAYMGKLQSDEYLITSDTIVWLDGETMGKPQNADDAKRMLRQLSGETHQVYTAVVLSACRDGKVEELDSLVDCTNVTFRTLTDEEIAYYVEKYRPFDKAGAYGVQEWIGYIGVEKLEGSYFNVMGFPLEKVYLMLKKYGF